MEKEYCKLHREKLLAAEVPYIHDSSVYGLRGYPKAQVKFICAGSFKLFGILNFKEQKSSMPAYYCRQCRILQREWLFDQLPESKGLLNTILKSHKDTDLYDYPVSMTARV